MKIREPIWSDTTTAIFSCLFYIIGVAAEHFRAYSAVTLAFMGVGLVVWLPIIDRIEWAKLDKKIKERNREPETNTETR